MDDKIVRLEQEATELAKIRANPVFDKCVLQPLMEYRTRAVRQIAEGQLDGNGLMRTSGELHIIKWVEDLLALPEEHYLRSLRRKQHKQTVRN